MILISNPVEKEPIRLIDEALALWKMKPILVSHFPRETKTHFLCFYCCSLSATARKLLSYEVRKLIEDMIQSVINIFSTVCGRYRTFCCFLLSLHYMSEGNIAFPHYCYLTATLTQTLYLKGHSASDTDKGHSSWGLLSCFKSSVALDGMKVALMTSSWLSLSVFSCIQCFGRIHWG